jgi:hypothetical protein
VITHWMAGLPPTSYWPAATSLAHRTQSAAAAMTTITMQITMRITTRVVLPVAPKEMRSLNLKLSTFYVDGSRPPRCQRIEVRRGSHRALSAVAPPGSFPCKCICLHHPVLALALEGRLTAASHWAVRTPLAPRWSTTAPPASHITPNQQRRRWLHPHARGGGLRAGDRDCILVLHTRGPVAPELDDTGVVDASDEQRFVCEPGARVWGRRRQKRRWHALVQRHSGVRRPASQFLRLGFINPRCSTPCHGILAPRHPGTLAPWHPGTLAPRHLGTLAPYHPKPHYCHPRH